MKGLLPLVLGIFGTFALSWLGLIVIPNAQIGHLDPQMDEDGNDPYPAPKSGMAERGRRVYVGNGCIYCHSQQVRADYAASDIERKWGERRSAPRDYLFDRPALLGKMRMGPDLANIGKRAPSDDLNAAPPDSTNPAAPAPAAPAGATPAAPAVSGPSPAPAIAAQTAAAPVSPTTDQGGPSKAEPLLYSAAWHHQHLYNPRSVNEDSNMPAYRFLYEKRRIGGQSSADAIKPVGHTVVPEGWEIVPSYDAKCLVAYLMSLDQSHALKEVKSSAPTSPAAPGKAVK
jgi:cytochrome c oxidase cbb3-type subunit 2